MHISVMNAPLRSAVMGSRLSAAWSTTTAAAAPAPIALGCQKYQTQLVSRYNRYNTQQKRAASTILRRPTPTPTSRLSSTPISTPTLLSIIRSSSTSSTSTTSTTSNNNNNNNDDQHPLDWNTFFTLRASRRRYTLISSILSATATTSTGMTVLATQNLENIGAQLMGLDPIAVMVLLTAAAGAAGWLVGPFLGGALWRAVNRRFTRDMAVKEKEFYSRIKKFRVDPSAQSFSNPVPDYYGEKIGSVAGYRSWLKDQRAYNRKKRNFV